MLQLAAIKALPWRLIAYSMAAVAVLAIGWQVHGWRQGYLGKAAAEARTAEIAQQASEAMALLAERHRQALEASEKHQNELSTLRAARDAAPPAPVLRLCREPRVPAPGSRSSPAPGPDAAAAPSGEFQEETRFDTRPLYDEADRADELAARLRALQEWVRATR